MTDRKWLTQGDDGWYVNVVRNHRLETIGPYWEPIAWLMYWLA